MMKAHLNLSPVVVSLKCRRIDSIIRKKVKGRAGYQNMYSVAKHLYMDNGEVDTIGFAIDKENLRILKAKIDAALIDDGKPNDKKLLNK